MADSNNCPVEITYGNILFSGTDMVLQKSCAPHTYNVGNYYNLPSQLGDAKYNNICPRGWSLPDNNDKTSYSNLLISYGIDNSASKVSDTYDAALINLPLSYLRAGYYVVDGSLNNQGYSGNYRMVSRSLFFRSGGLNPTNNNDAGSGMPVRCVSR